MAVTHKPSAVVDKPAASDQSGRIPSADSSHRAKAAVKNGNFVDQRKRKDDASEDDPRHLDGEHATSADGEAEVVAAQDGPLLVAQADAGASGAAAAEGGSAGAGAATAAASAAGSGISAGMIALGAFAALGVAAAAGGGGGGGGSAPADPPADDPAPVTPPADDPAPVTPPADSTAPLIQSMTAQGSQVVLTYSEALDAANIPASSAFTVTVGGVANPVTGVAVSGNDVTLTLTNAMPSGAAVVVSYTDPTAGNDANAIQDAAGNDAASFNTGVVSDGYVRGAQIYIDANKNGLADAGEALTGVVTDDNGVFILPAGSPAGVIIAVGGVNIDTGVPNTIPLKAPAGSTVVTPLTTLVQAVMDKTAGTTVAQATEAVNTALGLPVGTDLTKYDPLAVLAQDPTDANALTVQKAAVQVATLIAVAVEAPASGSTSTATANAVVDNLATQVGAPSAAVTVDLTDAAVVNAALGTASTAVVGDIVAATTAIGAATTATEISTAQSQALDSLAPAAPSVVLTAGSDTGVADNVTSDTTPTVRVSFNTTATDGTAVVAGNVVTVQSGTTQVGSATLTTADITNGYVDVTLSALTVDGDHTLTAAIADAANNISAASAGLTVTLDTIAPAAPAVVLTSDSGSSATDGITSVGTLNVTGVETGASVQYSTDGGQTWSATFTAQEGANAVQVRQIDVAGNESAAASISFTLDTSVAAPTVALTSDSGSSAIDGITDDGALTFSAAAADVTRSFTVNGGTASSSYAAPTTDGTYTVVVTDTDAAGNTASASLTFTLDTTIDTPTVALANDSGITSDGITNDASLSFSTAAADVTRSFTINGGTPSSTYTAPTTGGEYTVTVTDTDTAGNTASASIVFTLDTAAAAPTVALTTDSGSSATDGITSVGTLSVSGIETGATVEYSTDGGQAWSTSFTAAEGANSVLVRQTDVAGNTGTASLAFTLDTTVPTLSSATPADDATDVVTGSVVLTFNEAVARGTGNIVVSSAGGSVNIDVTDTTQVAISGNAVTITPTAGFAPNTEYTVTVGSGVVTDVAGNAYAGNSSNPLNFTMADNPSVSISTSETDGLLNISDSAAITFTLSQPSSDFTLADVTVSGGTLSNFAGSGTSYTATLTPAANSTATATLSVAAGAFTSSTGLGNIASSTLSLDVDTVVPATPTIALTTDSGIAADGITNDAELTVSTAAADVTRSFTVNGGTASSSYAAPTTDGTYSVEVTDTDAAGNTSTASLSFTLDTTIATPTVALASDSGIASDGITNDAALSFSAAAADVTRTFTVNGGTASSTYTAPTDGGTYTVTVTDTDTAGNTESASITFTLDTAAPTLDSATPADDATSVSPGANIVLTFSETVAAGTGNIVISDGTNSMSIDVTDSTQVTFSGTTVTINPTSNLDPSTTYNVQIAEGVITDVAGNTFAGITTATALDFTTAAAPTLSSSIDGVTNFDVTSNIVLTASESVTAVAGKKVYIINDGGAGFRGEATINTQEIDVTDTGKVTIVGNTITINPDFDLDFANDYHIMVDDGAFLGASGVSSVGTAGAEAMNFSTVAPSATSTAAASLTMTDGVDATVAGLSWWDAEGNGVPGGTAVARDFSGGDFAIVATDLGTPGIATNDFYIAVNNFAAGDLIYIDNHGDNTLQRQAEFNGGLIVDFGQAPTQVVTGASGTATGLNGGQFDVTVAGTDSSFSDTTALQVLLGNVTYEPILYG